MSSEFTFHGSRAAVAVSHELPARLAALGATAPSFICRKYLTSTDVRRDQSRLLLSRKAKHTHQRCALAEALTEAEKRLVNDQKQKIDPVPQNADENSLLEKAAKEKKEKGLLVTALDSHGREYAMRCRFLACNRGYRFINMWGRFLRKNKLVIGRKDRLKRRVVVELWAFRSCLLPHATGGEDAGHPDGALGLIILHHDEGDGGEQQAMVSAPPDEERDEEEEEAVVQSEAPASSARQEKGVGLMEMLAATVLLLLRTSK